MIVGSTMDEIRLKNYEKILAFTIYGNPQRKSNRRQIVTNKATGKPMLIKSKGALDYEKSFIKQVEEQGLPKLGVGTKDSHVAVEFMLYYKDYRSDVSVEQITDCMEKSGIINNDRYIRLRLVYGYIDKENPRAELTIYKIPNGKLE